MLPETIFMPLEFLRPLWLLGLIALILFSLWQYKQHQKIGDQSIIAPHLSGNIVTKASRSKHHKFALYSLLAITCIALSGPTIRSIDMPVYEMEKAQIIVFDLSYSMYATDIKPNRLGQAKFKAIDLIKQWSEGEKAMIAYAGDAFTVAPLTRDGNAIINHIPHLSPDIMPVRGSRADLALAKAIELLKNAGYSQGHIVFITDDISETHANTMIDMLKNENWIVSILAVATPQGAPITLSDGSLLKSASEEIIVPKLSAQPLYDIAKASQGLYLTSQNNSNDINQLGKYYDDVQRNEKRANETNSATSDLFSIDDGYWISFILLPLFLLFFRKGVFFAFLIAIYLPLSSPKLEAAEVPAQKETSTSIWKNNQQNAFNAYQNGEYQRAIELYDSPIEQGSALYKNKQFEQSLTQFTKATELEPQNADAFYNQGNSYAQLQQLDKAIEAYNKALAIQPEMKQAQENKTLIEQIKKQQEQQNKDQNSEQNQEQNQDQQDSEQSDDQQDQSQDQQNKQQDSEQDSQDQQQQTEKEKQQSEQEKQQEKEKQQSEQTEQQNTEELKDEQQAKQEMLEQTEQESNQELEELPNWLKNMPDDPSILLRRKMQVEYQKRAQSQPVKQQNNNGVIW
jgi:Ca-activated chloride channel family protein